MTQTDSSLHKVYPVGQKFTIQDIENFAYQDCVVKSGVDPDVYHLNFDPASGTAAYEQNYGDSDKTTNSGGSIEATRNLARCTGSPGYFLGNNFYLLSDLAGDTKAARYGIIKSKGIYRPEGPPAYGWIGNNRFRQLGGAPIALDLNKSTGVWEPRRYHQPKGKPLEIFFPRITVRVWKLVAEKAGLSMPEFPVIGLKGEAIGFWEWVENTNCPVILTEGEKKAAALISRGYAAIGLPGITTGYRVTERGEFVKLADGTEYQKATAWELHEALQKFDTPGREITILFDYRDGDYSENPEFKAATTTAKLLKNAIAKVAQLPGPDKGVDDFCVAGGDVDAVILAARSIDEIQKQFFLWLSKENRKKAWELTYPIAWECNQRYLDIPYPKSGLICIRSPKGTGKTHALRQLAAKAQAENRKVLVVTHRIVLGRAICPVVGIPWIEEMNSDGDHKIEGNYLGHGLCIDSLHPTSQAAFDPLAWEGALIIFDEVEQIDWHVLNSSTCRENRQAILASLKVLLATVLNSGGQVILQDADLSNISIDFVREFSGTDVKPWVAVNHWKPSEPWQIKFYDTHHVKGETQDNPSGLLKDSVDHVTNGGKIWVSTDSQKAKSKHGTKNLEKYYRSRCPGKKILRIDAESVANPEHPAYQCAEKINELAALYDIVICSPSLATGVSVDLRGHFTSVFGIYQGAISDNEVRQSLARVREPVDRFVWCRQIAVSKIGNGESNYKEVAKSTEKDCRYNLHLLKEFDFDLDKAYNPTVLKYWAKFAARINSSIWDFRETVREGLVAEGHILQDCGDDDRDSAGEIKALRIIGQVEEAVAVAEAEDIDREEFEKLEQQRSKTDTERHQEEKFRLQEIYKAEVTPELRQLHQDKWFPKILLEYLLTHNSDFLWMRDRKNIDSQRKSGDGQLCLQDVRQLMGKLKIHEALNTLQFCDRTKEWSNKSPEILEFADKALKFAADIKILTGITVSPKKVADNPIGIVQSFLAQLGLKLTGEQRRYGEERVRFYKFGGVASANVFDRAGNKIGEPLRLRAEIFKKWKERDELALFEFQHHGIAAVEADVTLDLKPSASKVQVKNDLYLGSVTASSIDIENIPSVTTNSTAEPHIETCPVSEKAWGWFQRKLGEWIKCRVLEFVEGRYLLEAKSMVDDGVARFRAFPEDLRWEAPI
ncbi:plasmid replication protein, CyRepA1 family [Microcoleus sp. herbarium2]|uniref:plasmid replication protein, CyRepA1 family n=2 Tax=Microcoleus sp. herbarium2 TaxID=3055433 RepID=UPI002FD57767